MSPCTLSLYEEKKIKSVKRNVQRRKGRGEGFLFVFLLYYKLSLFALSIVAQKHNEEHLMREDEAMFWFI